MNSSPSDTIPGGADEGRADERLRAARAIGRDLDDLAKRAQRRWSTTPWWEEVLRAAEDTGPPGGHTGGGGRADLPDMLIVFRGASSRRKRVALLFVAGTSSRLTLTAGQQADLFELFKRTVVSLRKSDPARHRIRRLETRLQGLGVECRRDDSRSDYRLRIVAPIAAIEADATLEPDADLSRNLREIDKEWRSGRR